MDKHLKLKLETQLKNEWEQNTTKFYRRNTIITMFINYKRISGCSVLYTITVKHNMFTYIEVSLPLDIMLSEGRDSL